MVPVGGGGGSIYPGHLKWVAGEILASLLPITP